MTELNRRVRISGADRSRIGRQLAEQYLEGATIRDLSIETGRSYGWVHGILSEAGVIRSRNTWNLSDRS